MQRSGGKEEHTVFRGSYSVCILEAESVKRGLGVKLKGWYWRNVLKTLEGQTKNCRFILYHMESHRKNSNIIRCAF